MTIRIKLSPLQAGELSAYWGSGRDGDAASNFNQETAPVSQKMTAYPIYLPLNVQMGSPAPPSVAPFEVNVLRQSFYSSKENEDADTLVKWRGLNWQMSFSLGSGVYHFDCSTDSQIQNNSNQWRQDH